MPVYLAILLAIVIVILTFIIIICNLCDDIIIDKIFKNKSKKNQYVIFIITIIFILMYICLAIYNFI